MPYTHRSKENLLREGIPGDRIYVTGNPISRSWINTATALSRARFSTIWPYAGQVFSRHHASSENVDVEERLRNLWMLLPGCMRNTAIRHLFFSPSNPLKSGKIQPGHFH